MRKLIILIAIFLASCASTPTGQTRKVQGEKYREVEKRLGPLKLYTTWEKKPSQWELMQLTLKRPAKWLLTMCLPLALVLTAATLANTGGMQKLTGPGAVLCGLSAIGAAAWIMAVTWVLVLIPIVVIPTALWMWKWRDRGFKWMA